MSYRVNDLFNFEGDRPFVPSEKQFLPSETNKRCYLFMNIVHCVTTNV